MDKRSFTEGRSLLKQARKPHTYGSELQDLFGVQACHHLFIRFHTSAKIPFIPLSISLHALSIPIYVYLPQSRTPLDRCDVGDLLSYLGEG